MSFQAALSLLLAATSDQAGTGQIPPAPPLVGPDCAAEAVMTAQLAAQGLEPELSGMDGFGRRVLLWRPQRLLAGGDGSKILFVVTIADSSTACRLVSTIAPPGVGTETQSNRAKELEALERQAQDLAGPEKEP